MRNWSFLIVEDSIIDIEVLTDFIKVIPFCEVTTCQNLDEVFSILKEKTFDIIFLDIKFTQNHLNGLELLKIIPVNIPVIIVSAFPEYAVKSFDIDSIVDFVEKPITFERMTRAVKRAINVTFNQNSIISEQQLYFKSGRKVVKFEVDDILFFKSYGVYSKVHLHNNTVHLVNEPFTSLLNDTLSSKSFRRVQKSYIVNISKITGFDQNFIYIENTKIPIGKTYRVELQSLFRLINS